MKYVFRVLSSEIKNSLKSHKSGVSYYTLPVVNNENRYYKEFNIAIPSYLTFWKKDNLYFILDDEEEQEELKIAFKGDTPNNVTAKEVLNIINKDLSSYLTNDPYYSRKHSHAINNFIPVGISVEDPDTGEKLLNKWSDIIKTICDVYPADLMAINPLLTNFIYPFEFKNFLSNRYVREYRSNIILFNLCFDKGFIFEHNENDLHHFIYYIKNGKKIPMYELISEKKFFIECEKRDKLFNAKKPFFRTFNDHGLSEVSVEFMNNYEGYKTRIIELFNDLERILELDEKSPKMYFVPALDSTKLIDLDNLFKTQGTVPLIDSQEYVTSYELYLAKLADFFDNDKIFYFSTEDIEIIDNEYKINSASQYFIDNADVEIYYDKKRKVVYTTDSDKLYSPRKPLLKVVTAEELKKLKDQVYNKWYSLKQLKFRK